MKTQFISLVLLGFIWSCDSSKTVIQNENDVVAKKSDTIKIANDSLEYEVIIIDPGFSNWLYSKAHPRGYYSESYLESRNRIWVTEWNNRAMQPLRYDPLLYEMPINYDNFTKYGYEVNYLIYNYLTYFQIVNKQRLSGFVPRP